MRTWPAVHVGAGFERAGDADLLQAELVDLDVAAVDEDAAQVFFHTPEARDRAAARLGAAFPHLHITPIDVPDGDWAARSQAGLRAVRAGNLVITPPWRVGDPAEPPGTTIVIQPSMGFGTGHHATTRLCLEHLQHLDLRGRSALDVGTGSGVLAIAASRLGAVHVLAIDDDPDAIASARENVELNPGTEVTLGILDLRTARLRPFDVVLANLTGALLVSAAGVLLQLTAPGGRLILSGFLEHEEADVLRAFDGCTVERRSPDEEWVCATLRRGAAPAGA
jgi:ribosomal protein L11 methyltransferase